MRVEEKDGKLWIFGGSLVWKSSSADGKIVDSNSNHLDSNSIVAFIAVFIRIFSEAIHVSQQTLSTLILELTNKNTKFFRFAFEQKFLLGN
jgi:hypothetical protein